MIGYILLALGAYYLIRRPKIAKMRAIDYPNVPAPQFERWRRLEILSIDVFLVATFGSAGVGLLLSFVAGSVFAAQGTSNQQVAVINICLIGGQLAVFLIGLTVSAVFGSRGAALRKSLGIALPK